MTFTLRRAAAADAATVADLFHRSFTATFGHLYPPADLAGFLAGCSIERFEGEINSPDFATMLGEVDGRLMGYCTLGPQELGPEGPKTGEGNWWVLRQLYLDEEAKGTGLALALTEWAIAESRVRGHDAIYLTVWIDNRRARRFYEKQGFVEMGRYAFQVGNTIDDDRILKLAL
jgi:ribosomal protein S18 acetylase RimI-like enzyme